MLDKIGNASQALSKLKEAADPPCTFHHLVNRDLSSQNIRARWELFCFHQAASQSKACPPDHDSVPFVHSPPPRSLQGHVLSEHLDINLLSRQM